MKFLISGDYHLKLVDSLGITVAGVNSRLTDRINSLTKVVNTAIEKQCDGFIILGDIFDKINPSEKLRKIFVKTVISPLIENEIPIIILMGNHDTNNDVVSFETEALLASKFKADSILFITKPETITIPVGDSDKTKDLLFLPYGYKYPEDTKVDYCFAHHGLSGAETGVGVIFRTGEEGNIEDFKQCPATFSGHYHKSQVLIGKTGNRFMYAGSINRWDFGERLDEKQCILLDTDIDEWEFIPVPDREFKQFNIVEGSSYETTENIENCIVKLVFEGTLLWYSSLDIAKIKNSYEKLKPHKVIVAKALSTVDSGKNILGLVESDSDEDIIKKYAKQEKIDKQILQQGLDIFNSV